MEKERSEIFADRLIDKALGKLLQRKRKVLRRIDLTFVGQEFPVV
jgi:hypothetical protein